MPASVTVEGEISLGIMLAMVKVTIMCQIDAFQMDAVRFQRADRTRSSWMRPNQMRRPNLTRPK